MQDGHTHTHTQKDGNGMDLTEAGYFKRRWQGYTTEFYKKDLNDPESHDGVITHLDPDMLECEVKWALGSMGVMEFEISCFKS